MGIVHSIGKVIVKNAGAMIIGGALFSVLDKLSKNLDRSKAVKDLQRKYEWLSSDLTRVEHDVDVLSRKVEYLEEEDEEEQPTPQKAPTSTPQPQPTKAQKAPTLTPQPQHEGTNTKK